MKMSSQRHAAVALTTRSPVTCWITRPIIGLGVTLSDSTEYQTRQSCPYDFRLYWFSLNADVIRPLVSDFFIREVLWS